MKHFRVNYIYMLEIASDATPRDSQFINTGLVMIAIWFLCLLGQLASFKHFIPYENSFFTFGLVLVTSLIIFLPIGVCGRKN